MCLRLGGSGIKGLWLQLPDSSGDALWLPLQPQGGGGGGGGPSRIPSDLSISLPFRSSSAGWPLGGAGREDF